MVKENGIRCHILADEEQDASAFFLVSSPMAAVPAGKKNTTSNSYVFVSFVQKRLVDSHKGGGGPIVPHELLTQSCAR